MMFAPNFLPKRSFSLTSAVLRRPPLVKKPRHASWPRTKLITIAEPSHPVQHPTTEFLWQNCGRMYELSRQREKKPPNGLEVLFVETFRKRLQESKAVAIFHCNQITYYPERSAWQQAKKMGMELCRFNYTIAKATLENTKFENMLRFWESNVIFFDQYILFCPTADAKKILTFDKKVPELLVMGAIIENRFLKRSQIKDMSDMPPIEYLHSELSGILQMSTQKTVSLLCNNQQKLSSNLSQYIKDQTPEGK